MSEPAALEDCMSEHDAFRSMWSSLQSSINPQDISGILYEKKVISKSEREEIDNVRNTRHNRITVLLECVERMIRIDKETFWIFVEVLKPEYNKLAMQLQTQVRKDDLAKPAPSLQVSAQSHLLPVRQHASCKICHSRVVALICIITAMTLACAILRNDVLSTPSSISAPDKNYRQQWNKWKKSQPSNVVSSEQCSVQDQKHQCSITVYAGKLFKSMLHQKKTYAQEEAAELALAWVHKPGKTRLKEYCDQFRGKQLNLVYETNPAPDGFQSSVMVHGLELDPVKGDVKKTKTEAEHSAAENALIEMQKWTSQGSGTAGI